jgi:hypothetical protein
MPPWLIASLFLPGLAWASAPPMGVELTELCPPTMQKPADSLHHRFGVRFRLEESSTELHRTPLGATQPFLYCDCKVE